MNARIIRSGRHTPRGGSSVGLLREWRATSGAVALLAVCRLKPITAAMKAHLPTREHLLIQPGEPLGAPRNAGSETGGTGGHCGRRGTHPVRLSFRSVSTSSESSSRALAAMRATREAPRRARRVSVSALGEVVSVESGMRVAKRMRDEAVIDAPASGCRFRQQRPPTPHLACKHALGPVGRRLRCARAWPGPPRLTWREGTRR